METIWWKRIGLHQTNVDYDGYPGVSEPVPSVGLFWAPQTGDERKQKNKGHVLFIDIVASFVTRFRYVKRFKNGGLLFIIFWWKKMIRFDVVGRFRNLFLAMRTSTENSTTDTDIDCWDTPLLPRKHAVQRGKYAKKHVFEHVEPPQMDRLFAKSANVFYSVGNRIYPRFRLDACIWRFRGSFVWYSESVRFRRNEKKNCSFYRLYWIYWCRLGRISIVARGYRRRRRRETSLRRNEKIKTPPFFVNVARLFVNFFFRELITAAWTFTYK